MVAVLCCTAGHEGVVSAQSYTAGGEAMQARGVQSGNVLDRSLRLWHPSCVSLTGDGKTR
jgi:hypothetical protein